MAMQDISTGYKPEFGLGALYQGMNAANANDSNNLELVKQYLENMKTQENMPLDLNIKGYESDLASAKRNSPSYIPMMLRGYEGQMQSQDAAGQAAQALLPFKIAAEQAKARNETAAAQRDFNITDFQRQLVSGTKENGEALAPDELKALKEKYLQDAKMAYQTPEFLGKQELQNDKLDALIQARKEGAKGAQDPFIKMHGDAVKTLNSLIAARTAIQKQIDNTQGMKEFLQRLQQGDASNPPAQAFDLIGKLRSIDAEIASQKSVIGQLGGHLGFTPTQETAPTPTGLPSGWTIKGSQPQSGGLSDQIPR